MQAEFLVGIDGKNSHYLYYVQLVLKFLKDMTFKSSYTFTEN